LPNYKHKYQLDCYFEKNIYFTFSSWKGFFALTVSEIDCVETAAAPVCSSPGAERGLSASLPEAAAGVS
jgi:hypothetical protein